MVLYAGIEVVRPRVALEKLLSRLLYTLVWQDMSGVDDLTADGAAVNAVLVIVAISVCLLLRCPLTLRLEVLLNDNALICLPALDQHWVCH